MFSAGFAIIVEGLPPDDTPQSYVILFSISLAISITALFLGINLGNLERICMSTSKVLEVTLMIGATYEE